MTLIFIFLVFFSGCIPAPLLPNYTIQQNHTAQFQTLGGNNPTKVAINPISKDNKIRSDVIYCSEGGGGNIDLKQGQSFEKYIEQALVSELKKSGLYSESSQKRLNLHLDKLELAGFPGFAEKLLTPTFILSSREVKWNIGVTFDAEGIQKSSISSSFLHPMSEGPFDYACFSSIKKFNRAVANLITVLLGHAEFQKFISN